MKLLLKLIIAASAVSIQAKAQVTDAYGIPRDTSFTLDQTYRKEVKKRPYIIPVRASLPAGVKAFEGITYKSVSYKSVRHDLKMNIYRPGDGKTYPVLIMIHGGGWNSGTPWLQVPLAQNVAARGYVTIPVEYRLIPEALYPAGVNDLEDAIKWVHKHAAEYGIDRKHIAVSGCSAGGQLAMLLGMRNKSGLIKAVINMDGISTFETSESIDRAQKAFEEGKPLPVDAKWLGGTYNNARKHWQDASGLNWISKKSAPVCFINSSIPRFHNGRDEAVSKLSRLKIHTEIHEHTDTPHTYWFFKPWFGQTVDWMSDFLDRMLK